MREDFDATVCRAFAGRFRALHMLRLSPTGIIEGCNAAVSENVGAPSRALVGAPIRNILTAADADRLEAELRVSGGREEPLLLNFCDAQHVPYTLECHLDVDDGGATLVGEPTLRRDRRDQRQLLDIAADLSLLTRDRARSEQVLRGAQQALLEREAALRERAVELEARNAQLRRLASQLVLAEQRTREDVAKTIHDDLQQLIFGAMLKLDRLAKRTAGQGHDELIARLRADLEESVRAARELSVDLFAPVLHDGGLPPALSWLASRIQEKYGVTVSVSVDPRANPEAADVRTLLFESVRELLFNAVKHAHTDRIDVELTLSANDDVCILVRDDGVGFEPAPAIEPDRRGPLGLGLFSIRERVALLGGRFEIESAPGCGATFRLSAPRRNPSLDSSPTDRSPETYQTMRSSPRRVTSIPAHPLRVLIVDDHAVVRAGLRELFADHPSLLVVGEAANGVEAIAQADADRPDVIIMDTSMPQMDGIEATRRIHAAHPDIHIIGLSTHDHEDGVRRMREAGAVAYFTKGEGADRLLSFLVTEHATKNRLRA